MQAYSTTANLRRYRQKHDEHLNDEEGFAEDEPESLIIPKQEINDDSGIEKAVQKKPRVLYHQPKIKLTFVSRQKNAKEQLRKSIISKQQRSHQARSLDISKRESRKSLQFDLLSDCVAKIKRTVVGENISIPTFSLNDSKAVKSYIFSSGTPLIYEQAKEVNTHGYLRSLKEQNLEFLESEYNQLLKMKLKQSFIMSKKPGSRKQKQNIEFLGDFESANIQFVSQVGENQYDLYLRNDTNTHGHQSWFLFRVKNNLTQSQPIIINICNLKRNLTVFGDGGKVYTRKVGPLYQVGRGWQQAGENVQFKLNGNAKFTNAKVYRLSFTLSLQMSTTIEVGLLPAYTYSDMLHQIDNIKGCPYLSCETLTYSLVGLAVPLLTFTRGSNPFKQVILVSCRVHPGQTNSSFMCKGLLRWLAEQTPLSRQFLEKHIIKVIPMLNPDGVLFGNFRTNFLGADLNRSFDSDDEIINPEVSALKELGMKLKEEFGERFNLFLDLHGHSSQRNIFSYGPDYDITETNFYQIRLLPKILNLRSKMFKYPSCTFKLQDYKRTTARGFFLNSVGILAYTIEAGYGFFQDEGKLCLMGPDEWMQFGRILVEGLLMLSKISKLSLMKSKLEIKKALGEANKEQMEIIRRFKKQFKKEKEEPLAEQEKKKDKGGEDSDGEDDCQDYTRAEKEEVIKRVAQTVAPSMILPRVLKPSIVYPTVTPKLFKYREQFQQSQLKIIYTKRVARYSGLRMSGNSYIHSLKGIQLLRPDTKQLYF